ncbi:hypothetical protein STEG23_010002 [Scotinomys teguina]
MVIKVKGVMPASGEQGEDFPRLSVSPHLSRNPCSPTQSLKQWGEQRQYLLEYPVSAEGSQACAKGCELCSEVNGCLKCSPKLFILLERNDIRQVGVCLPSCPPGYFDARNPDMNKCIKCKIEHCEACFSHNFCTKCREDLYLHKGRCYPACPEGSTAANSTMECSSPAQCEMSEWSPWGPCSKKRKLCGFRKGSEERTRRVLHAPGGDHTTCTDTKETRKCTVRRTPCPEELRTEPRALCLLGKLSTTELNPQPDHYRYVCFIDEETEI